MLRNIIQVTIRHFNRQRFYSSLNLLGLTTGLVGVFLISLWVQDEWLTDRWHQEVERIFRITSNLDQGDGSIVSWSATPCPMGDVIKSSVTGIEATTRTINCGFLFQNEEKSFNESGIYADPGFFQVFSFDKISGTDPKEGIGKNWISISQKMASKFFDGQNPVGKTLKMDKHYDLIVVSVFKDITSRSSLKFDYIIPFEIYKENRGDGFTWNNYDPMLFIKVGKSSKAGSVSDEVNRNMSLFMGAEKSKTSFYIQPFSESYLNQKFENGKPNGGRIQYVVLFSIVALFVLIIACVNFINMATAKAITRAKEVGIRKVVGAQRVLLIVQFMGEAITLSTMAVVLAVSIVYFLLPGFNQMVRKNVTLDFADPMTLTVIMIVILVTGLVAGTYPAIVLSSFKPVSVLKGTLGIGQPSLLRKALIISQFCITTIMIAGAITVYRQVEFIRSKSLGYDREAIIRFFGISLRGKGDAYEAFKNEALQNPAIRFVSRSDNSLVKVNNQNGSVSWPSKTPDDKHLFRTVCVDVDFVEAMGLTLTAGRSFSKNYNDSTSFIITKKTSEIMGFSDPVGQEIEQWGMKGRIVGLVEDFHSRSLHTAIDPVILMYKPEWAYLIFVKYESGKTEETITHLKQLFAKYNPDYPFEYNFLDEDFEKAYDNENVMRTLAIGFTGLAVIISILGMMGLATFTAEQKRKEIGIRKTLGASVSSLIFSMSTDFVKLSIAGALVGCPLAYFLIYSFLEGYAYRIELQWAIYAYTIGLGVILSLLAVMMQVIRSASANPVDALRQQ